MKMLYLMVGVPGSGKSTLCEKYKGETTAWISRDAIRFSLLKDGDDYFAKEDETWKKFVATIQEALDNPIYENVIADATHLNERSRNKLLKCLTLTDKVGLGAIVMDVDYQTCLIRNNKREGRARVPAYIMKSMAKSASSPIHDKAYNYYLVLFADEQGNIHANPKEGSMWV